MTRMAWRTCGVCGGSGTIKNPKNGKGPMTCPACQGKGGFDTRTVKR